MALRIVTAAMLMTPYMHQFHIINHINAATELSLIAVLSWLASLLKSIGNFTIDMRRNVKMLFTILGWDI